MLTVKTPKTNDTADDARDISLRPPEDAPSQRWTPTYYPPYTQLMDVMRLYRSCNHIFIKARACVCVRVCGVNTKLTDATI